jgi:hypothetical protein
MSEPKFPAGWDAEEVKRLFNHYEGLPYDERVADDGSGIMAEREGQTGITVPEGLLPQIRPLHAANEARSA